MLSMERLVAGSGNRDCLVVTSLQGKVLFWSRGAAAFLGHGSREMTGQPLGRILPAKHRRLDDLNHQELAGDNAVRNLQVKLLHKDGTVRRCLQTMIPVKDGGGRVVASLRLLMDLTALRDAELSLRSSLAQVRELSAQVPAEDGAGEGTNQFHAAERTRILDEYLRIVRCDAQLLEGLLAEVRGIVGDQSEALFDGAYVLEEEALPQA